MNDPGTLRRGLAALGLALALAVGVPVVLWLLAGNPLPATLPTIEQVSRALTRGEIAEGTLVKALACVCWFAWSQLVVAMAAEAVAVVRGGPAPRVPTMAVFHGTAAALVTAAVPLFVGVSGDDPLPPPLPEPLAAELTAPLEADGVPEPAPDLPVHVVAHRETLWSVAEQRLGDPYRWREVFELNRGRHQPGGARLARPDQPLRQGWTLLLPADAEPDHDTVAGRPEQARPAVDLLLAAQAADRLAGEAEVEWRAALELVAPAAADVDAPARAGSLLARLAGAGLLAGGVVWSLDRIRRTAERKRLPDVPVPAPPDDVRRLELGLRAAARPDLVTFVDAALRQWGARLAEAGRCPPPVVGINVAEDMSLLFSAPEPDAVEGFTVEDDGFSWVTSVWGGGDQPDDDAGPAPLPALFTVGHTERSQVLLNAEATGVVSVTGSGAHVAETLFAMAAELATGPWGARTRVVTVGFGRELARLPTVTVATTLAEVMPDLRAGAERTASACREQGVNSAVEARVRGMTGDVWTPTVVLAAGLGGAEAEQLATLAATGPAGGVAAVVAGHLPAASWRIEVTEDEVTLDPVGVTLRRHGFPAGAREALAQLLADVPPATAAPARPRPRVHVVDGDAPSVEVRVLGPVEVAGAGDFTRRKALELVTYLALHRRGADADVLSEALWPDRLVSPRTLHGIVSLARRALGEGPGGGLLLPHAGADGTYRLPPEVALDAERFTALAGRAGETDPEEAIDHLARALHLIRGRPFTVTGDEYLWVHGEALMTALVAEVADAAHRLACLYLEARDSPGAWWATQQGLLASPGNEQLYRDRMSAADVDGNPAGVEEVMEELCRAVEVDRSETHEVLAVLHPMTVELYQRLARRPVPPDLLSRA